MVALPLKIRVDIRDQWERHDSRIRSKIKELQDLLGKEISIVLDWEVLWDTLQSKYPEKELFVPSVVTLIATFITILHGKLADENDEEWTDEFLEQVVTHSGLQVVILVGDGPKPKLKWNKHGSSLELYISNGPPSSPDTSANTLTNDLACLFQIPTSKPTDTYAVTNDDWSEIIAEPSSSSSNLPMTATIREAPDIMPTLATLPRPESLFSTVLPYQMLLTKMGAMMLIQGSHQPSLELIAEYFQKWTRKNPNDVRNPPVITIELRSSHFGTGACFDSVIMKPTDERLSWIEVNPALVLAFVEGVLGYTLVKTDGNHWYLRREKALVVR